MKSFLKYSIFFILILIFPIFANKLEPVKIQLKWLHQFQFAGYYAAIEKGFYKDEGLEVTLLERDLKSTVSDNIDAVLKGKAQYGVADAGLLLAKYEHKPVVLLAQIFQHSPLVLLSKRGSGIISPFEMIGKTVMYDAADVQFRSMLQNTIGEKGDFNTINHSGNIEEFINGKVDVISSYITNEPFLLRNKGIEINIIRPQNYGVDFYGDNLFTSKSEIEKHPARVEKVLRATLKGWKYALDNSDEIVTLIKTKYASEKNLEHLKYEAKITSQMILGDIIEIGYVDRERFKMIADTYFNSGVANTKLLPDDFFYQIETRYRETFSKTEIEWIKKHPTITVASDPSWEPFEFVNKKGVYNGIAIDYLEKIEQMIPVKFEYLKDVTWQELIDLGKKGEVDIFSCITKTDERSEYLNFTTPYIHIPISIFSRIDVPYIGNLNQLKGKTASVVEGYAIHEMLKTYHPEIILMPVKNVAEAINAVGDQKAFCFIGNQMSTSHYITKFGITHIKIAGETPYENDLSIGVRKDWIIFTGILQKALNQINEEERLNILNQWITVNYEHKFDSRLIWKLILGSFFVILVFIVWNRILKRQVEKRSRELSRSILNLHEEVEEKKRMMDALNKSERKFKAIYDQAPIGIGIMDSDSGKFLEINHEYCRITGYSESELKEKTFMDITHEDDIQKNLNHMKLLNDRSISTYEIEKRYYHKNGKIVWVSLIVVPLWDEKNQNEHLAIIYDITYRKESEKQKKILEKQLRETQKMEAIGTLAGGIAHDFNNILGAMLGFTDLTLENIKNDEENKRRLEYVMQGGKRAKELINQILSFSREKEEELKPLYIKPVIKEVLKLLRASIPSTIQIESELLSESYVKADAAQIHQVIMNICTNAKYAMKENGGIMTISSKDVFIDNDSNFKFVNLKSGNYMKITISDTGKGIEKDVMSRIYEPFFTTKKKGEGTGLGLSVVHGIIRSYGGIIDVDSKRGKGTSFILYIPLIENTDSNPETIKKDDEILKKAKGKILIIDDEELILEMLESVLVSLGYDVFVKNDPIEAWEHLKTNSNKYDLIISDITMPKLTGDKLCEKIKEINSEIPFILTTGYTEEKPEILKERSGAEIIIKKPFIKNEIALVIRDVIEKRDYLEK